MNTEQNLNRRKGWIIKSKLSKTKGETKLQYTRTKNANNEKGGK